MRLQILKYLYWRYDFASNNYHIPTTLFFETNELYCFFFFLSRVNAIGWDIQHEFLTLCIIRTTSCRKLKNLVNMWLVYRYKEKMSATRRGKPRDDGTLKTRVWYSWTRFSLTHPLLYLYPPTHERIYSLYSLPSSFSSCGHAEHIITILIFSLAACFSLGIFLFTFVENMISWKKITLTFQSAVRVFIKMLILLLWRF